ncbi:S1C family serine protease [Cryptosporangium aurantiacum]|uniref:Putative serine protease PepD n=1 Tax=Cryptosporangium aurantiacum TaxID=134849 RepID=A0A1M7ILP1_9ACTN|nr:trypsin-like peptidase domain-containing protein [Cryptosporangium aurantiacum]SHM41742.1 putative serine protease PepD [Cryptosporangium aurantiacum]
MDESHRSSAAGTGGDQAGTPPTDPSRVLPSGAQQPSSRPSDASSPWAAPQAPAPSQSPSSQPTPAPAPSASAAPAAATGAVPAPGAAHVQGAPSAAHAAGGPAAPGVTGQFGQPGHFGSAPGGPHQTGPHQTGPHQTGPFPAWTAGGASHPTTPLGTPAPAPARRRGPLALAIAGGALVLALVAGGTGAAVGVAVSDRNSGNGVTINQETSTAATRASDTGSVEKAAATALKSVVTIAVTASSGAGTGSGVVLDSSGHIITNNHVVEAAADGGTITVTLANGETRSATIVGRDPSSDIAVIKVSDASGLTPATFAASSTVKTGQTVLAIGAPLGLSNTVTEGIVSALNRPVRTGSTADQNTVLDAVQTDAAINPGNSGGALVDLSGRVIGINSAIATVSSGSSGFGQQESQSGNIGVGFAIPSDTALNVAKQLIEDGTAEHATLGVSAQDTQSGTGAQIAQVTSGSAADKAGLKTGDVVTAIGDRAVTDTDGLVAAVRSHNPGETVKVTYQRDGKTSTASATLNSSST